MPRVCWFGLSSRSGAPTQDGERVQGDLDQWRIPSWCPVSRPVNGLGSIDQLPTPGSSCLRLRSPDFFRLYTSDCFVYAVISMILFPAQGIPGNSRAPTHKLLPFPLKRHLYELHSNSTFSNTIISLDIIYFV